MSQEECDQTAPAADKPDISAGLGRPGTEEPTRAVSVRISVRAHGLLEKFAAYDNVTKSDLLRESIELFVASREASFDASAPIDADDRCAELRGSLLCMHLLETVLNAEPAFDAQTKHHFVTAATAALYGSPA